MRPAQLTAALTGSAQTTEHTTVTVGDRELDAIAVDVSYQISGDVTGSWREQIWFSRRPLLRRSDRPLQQGPRAALAPS